jgi:hypothetical protein
MDTVDELKPVFITLNFADSNGIIVTPSSLEYFLMDYITKASIISTQIVVPTSNEYEIYIAGSYNAIIDTDNEYEVKILSLKWAYQMLINGSPIDVEDVAEITYRVRNLRSLPTT